MVKNFILSLLVFVAVKQSSAQDCAATSPSKQIRFLWTDASAFMHTHDPLRGFLAEAGLTYCMTGNSEWKPYCFSDYGSRTSNQSYHYTIVRNRPCDWPGLREACTENFNAYLEGAKHFQKNNNAKGAKWVFWWQFLYFKCNNMTINNEITAFADSVNLAIKDNKTATTVIWTEIFKRYGDKYIKMHEDITRAVNAEAKSDSLKPVVVPTIVLYKKFIEKFGALPIQPTGDGAYGHQNNLGGYLNACLTFTYVTGIDPRPLNFNKMNKVDNSGTVANGETVPPDFEKFIKDESWKLYTTYFTPVAASQFRTAQSVAVSSNRTLFNDTSSMRKNAGNTSLYTINGRLMHQYEIVRKYHGVIIHHQRTTNSISQIQYLPGR